MAVWFVECFFNAGPAPRPAGGHGPPNPLVEEILLRKIFFHNYWSVLQIAWKKILKLRRLYCNPN